MTYSIELDELFLLVFHWYQLQMYLFLNDNQSQIERSFCYLTRR